MSLADVIAAHVAPRVILVRGEEAEAYFLTVGWGGYYVDKDVTALYMDAIHGLNGATQALKDMAHDFVVELARAIARGEDGMPIEDAVVVQPHSEAEILEAEIEASEDEGEPH